MRIDSNLKEYAIGCHMGYCPTFGNGHDIYIGNFADRTYDNYSNLGLTYAHPNYASQSNKAKSFLAGAHQFQLCDIEVYQKVI
jgi:hypothetical protein